MDRQTLTTLFLVAAVAASSPLIAKALARLRVSAVVLEIGLGILIGPALLGLAATNDVVVSLGDLGLAFLMFLAGYEIDFTRVKGAPLRLAATRWMGSVAIAFACAFLMVIEDQALSTLFVGLALTTTALATILPMLRESGLIETDLGTSVLAAGVLGEFGPILAIALLLTGDNPVKTSVLLAAFVALAGAAAWAAMRARPPKVITILHKELHTTAQLPIRISMLLIIGLLWIASDLGLDVLLGAFAAGIVIRLGNTGDDAEAVRGKLEAIGYGFLVPLFFVVTGIRFDVTTLTASWGPALRIPLFLLAFLVVRGLPNLFGKDGLRKNERAALAFLSSTELPLVVVITTIGLSTGRMRADNATGLVGAAMLSVMLFPAIGLALAARGRVSDSTGSAGLSGTGAGADSPQGETGGNGLEGAREEEP